MDNWPKISVITPSYNQAQFIEATLLSVLDQDYPNIEYIVIDGGSTDGSVDIIKKYAHRLTYWVSEKDRGQSHAINKGFLKATGQILCWLNSDDTFTPGALKIVAETLADGNGVSAMVGRCWVVFQDGRPALLHEAGYENRRRLLEFWKGYHMPQAAIFWRREVYEKVGLLNEDMHMIMDFDYWARIAEHYDFKALDHPLATANYHADAKTGDGYRQYQRDLRKHSAHYWGSPLQPEYWVMFASIIRGLYIPVLQQKLRRTLKRDARGATAVAGEIQP